ncbi:MAG: LapA family protein [Leptolyngbyaceae cyanobacterium CRU_2_3]|nr:LapA family protein [Leptolyngbyaceae cyanobacterium CRU_2_3]
MLPYLEEIEKQRQQIDRIVRWCGWIGVISITGLLLLRICDLRSLSQFAKAHLFQLDLGFPLDVLRFVCAMGFLLSWVVGLGADFYRRWQAFRHQSELRNLRQQQEAQELQHACATQECWVCHYWSHPAQFIKGFEHPCAVHPAGRPGEYCPDWRQRPELDKGDDPRHSP